jgi:ATP-dependent Lon protease
MQSDYVMDALDSKLNEAFDGKVVRKDLLHRIKKGTNVPTFVLEFLLARYCASNDPAEIQAGMEAVLSTLQENYVRPDEANAAQSRVAVKGKHKFIDKVHVRYVEKEKRHWASLENFASQRIAIGEKFYRDNDRLLEGGIWAEVVIAHNDIDADAYAFYVEELRPIQLSRFDFASYGEAKRAFSRDEWMDVVLRSVGLEPAKLSQRVKLHFIARLAPLAFDEVGGIKVKDPDTIQIMKDYMANGRFSRGVEVIEDASMAFVGNIDMSVEQIVNSTEYDLFQPLPEQFDLAVMDRFACYLPGWEMPKNSSAFLTERFGLITDYLAEAFHHRLKHSNRYEEVSKRLKLGLAVEGRDEKGIKKTLCAMLKILHPADSPTDEEFDEYVAYAIECRRRVKEQMNKRKPDDEFARIDLSFFDRHGTEVVVNCPESSGASATLEPARRQLPTKAEEAGGPTAAASAFPAERQRPAEVSPPYEIPASLSEPAGLTERHYTIAYGDTGHSYDTIFGPYLLGAKSVVVEDPYIRMPHQIANFVRFCETVVKAATVRSVTLITSHDQQTDMAGLQEKLDELKQSLLEYDVALDVRLNNKMHDREVHLDNGWTIKIGRGLDFYQKPDAWFAVGATDLSLRRCLETKIDVFRATLTNG